MTDSTERLIESARTRVLSTLTPSDRDDAARIARATLSEMRREYAARESAATRDDAATVRQLGALLAAIDAFAATVAPVTDAERTLAFARVQLASAR